MINTVAFAFMFEDNLAKMQLLKLKFTNRIDRINTISPMGLRSVL